MSWERSPGRAPELTDRLLYAMRQDSYGMAKDSTYYCAMTVLEVRIM